MSKMKIWIDEDLKKEYGNKYGDTYRIDWNNDYSCVVDEVDFDTVDVYEVNQINLVKKNDKYYLFATSNSGSWYGKKIVDSQVERYLNVPKYDKIEFFESL